jgi:hypothetical protein
MAYHPVRIRFTLFLATAVVILIALPACSVNVKKGSDGEDKKVDIETPVGAIHVDKGADVRDTGLPVYPGARVTEKHENGEDSSANVNISAGVYGVRVVAVEYESDAAPDKIVAYYKEQLKKFGPVLECHVSHHGDASLNYHGEDDKGSDKDSQNVSCDHNDQGKNIELKAGTRDNQRIVSVEPQDKGAKFALVLVQLRGKDTI